MRLHLIALPLVGLLTACSLLPSNKTPQNSTTERMSGWLNTATRQLESCSPEQNSLHLTLNSPLEQQLQQHCEMQDCFVDLLVESSSLAQEPAKAVQWLRIDNESAGCQTQYPAGSQLIAQGNEPFWSLLISQQGMLLEQPGQPAQALPHIEEALPDGSLHYSSQVNHEQLNLWLSPQPCTDSMSGAYRHLTARLEWQGQSLSGCAYYTPDNPIYPL